MNQVSAPSARGIRGSRSPELRTVTIMAYYGTWPVGIATAESNGTWTCRVVVDPYSVEVATEKTASERKAVQFLNSSRWTKRIKKIRLPVPETLAAGSQA